MKLIIGDKIVREDIKNKCTNEHKEELLKMINELLEMDNWDNIIDNIKFMGLGLKRIYYREKDRMKDKMKYIGQAIYNIEITDDYIKIPKRVMKMNLSDLFEAFFMLDIRDDISDFIIQINIILEYWTHRDKYKLITNI